MEQNIIKCTSKNVIGQKQMVINSRFAIDPNNPIGKILAIYAKPMLKNSECTSGKVGFSGSVCFKLIYLSEDGKTITSVNSADFTDEMSNVDVGPKTYADVQFKVVDVTTPSVKSNEVKVSCVLDVTVSCENCIELETSISSDDIYLKKGEMSTYNVRERFSETFELEEEFKLNDEVDSIVNVDYDICVKEVLTGTNYATISGTTLYTISYENENNAFVTYTESVPFKQDITLDGVTKDSVVTVSLFTYDSTTKTSVSQLEKGNEVKVNATFLVNGSVYERQQTENVIDAYSTKSYVEFDQQTTSIIDCINNYCFDTTVKEKVSLDSNSDISVLGTLGNNIVLSNYYVNDGKIICEGVIATTLIYSYNDTKQINSKIIEVPFVIEKEQAESQSGNAILNVKASITELNVDVDSNGDADIVSKICLCVNEIVSSQANIICAVTPVREREARDYAIEIVLGQEGKTLWDVAKEMGVSTEMLTSQNPNLPSVLQGGEKIVVYYGI